MSQLRCCHHEASKQVFDTCNVVLQVDTDPIPHVIVDVRKPDEVAYNPLPQALMGGVNIPGDAEYDLYP